MTHESIQILALNREDLTAAEREIVDTHLADCQGCRELLAALQWMEDRATELGSLPAKTDADLYQLAQPELKAEKVSLQALGEELATHSGVGIKS
jgi:hypothetical protein